MYWVGMMAARGKQSVSGGAAAGAMDFLAFGGIPVYGAPVLRAVLVEGSAKH